jgi:hypothetical protein
MWPYIWIGLMVGLVVATCVVAMRENKARAAAVKKMTPQPIDENATDMPDAIDDGFGETDPLDSFGGEVASLDEDAFK